MGWYIGCRIGLPGMSITTGKTGALIVPLALQPRAGIKPGDQLEWKAFRDTITITAVRQAAYKPTKAELSAIRRGEQQIARGETVGLRELLDGLDNRRRDRRVSRQGPK